MNFNTLDFLQNHPEIQRIILLTTFIFGLPIILRTLYEITASYKIRNLLSPELQMHLSRYLRDNSRWNLYTKCVFFFFLPLTIGFLIQFIIYRQHLYFTIFIVYLQIVMIFAFNKLLMPPAVLLLSNSSEKADVLLKNMNKDMRGLRTVALLKPCAENAILSGFSYFQNNLRSEDCKEWKGIIYEMIQFVPLIVIAIDNSLSNYLNLEINTIKKYNHLKKCIFIDLHNLQILPNNEYQDSFGTPGENLYVALGRKFNFLREN